MWKSPRPPRPSDDKLRSRLAAQRLWPSAAPVLGVQLMRTRSQVAGGKVARKDHQGRMGLHVQGLVVLQRAGAVASVGKVAVWRAVGPPLLR